MAVPGFQTIMLPLVQMMTDQREYSLTQMVDHLAMKFQLSEDDLSEQIPSGRQKRFYNRVAWATTHLKKAAVIENTRRGVFRLTQRGADLLTKNLPKIDLTILRKYPEFVEFRNSNRSEEPKVKITVSPTLESIKTPDELLYESYRTIRDALATEILEKVMGCSPAFFEGLVVELLVKMGYGGTREDAGQAIGRSGDGGIDGIIKEDRLGLDAIYLQAKRWENTVGSPEIQKFAGALQGRRAKKGVFITTSEYSKGARDFASAIENKIILIDGVELADLMIDYNVGVSVSASYEIKKIDSDYFVEE